MRQRTEVFASIILLATVLRQGKKKKKIVSKLGALTFLNFKDCMTFDTLTIKPLLLLLHKKKFKMFIV